jgi:hypothetical protein
MHLLGKAHAVNPFAAKSMMPFKERAGNFQNVALPLFVS